MIVDTEASMRFLRTAYEPDDWIALFLKSYKSGRTMQRVGPLSLFLQPNVHAWLRAMNARGYNCYVGVNSIKRGVRARTKDSIGSVRHVFLETDDNGQQLVETIAAGATSRRRRTRLNRRRIGFTSSGASVDSLRRVSNDCRSISLAS